MNQRFRYSVIGMLTVLLVACSFAPEEKVPPIEYSDLIGEWTADYSRYNREPRGVTLPNGEETLVLRADGTFEQDFQAAIGYHRKVSGKWRAEKIDYIGWTRIYLNGAIYYLEGLPAARDPSFGVAAWDPIVHQYVSIGNRPGVVILYARRLLWDSKYDSKIPCGRKYDIILQHLPIGDLDAPTWVTFCRPGK